MKTLQESWREYRDAVYPADLPADQNAQLHQAWFSASFDLLYRVLEEVSRMSDDEAVSALKQLQDEARAVCSHRADAVKSHN